MSLSYLIPFGLPTIISLILSNVKRKNTINISKKQQSQHCAPPHSSFLIFHCWLSVGQFPWQWKQTMNTSTRPDPRWQFSASALCSLSFRKEMADSQQGPSPPYLGPEAFVRVDEPGCQSFSTQNDCPRPAASCSTSQHLPCCCRLNGPDSVCMVSTLWWPRHVEVKLWIVGT